MRICIALMTKRVNAAIIVKNTRLKTFLNAVFSKKYLLYTNVCLSMTLSAFGDIVEQNYEIFTEELTHWDSTRTRNMSISGCFVGVICHHWYNYLDHKLPGRTVKTVARKVLVDQLVCSPVTLLAFFATLAVLEGQKYDEFVDDVKKKGKRLYLAEWVIWPPAQIINFYLLPNKYRVLYDNTISLGYDIYTSYVRHDKT